MQLPLLLPKVPGMPCNSATILRHRCLQQAMASDGQAEYSLVGARHARLDQKTFLGPAVADILCQPAG